MTNVNTVSTDPATIATIIERGFDPALPVDGDDFRRLITAAELIETAGRTSLPRSIASMDREFGETGAALMLPVAVGRRWLTACLDQSTVSLSAGAVDNLTETLIRRLVTLLQQTVHFESIVSRTAKGIDGSHDTDAPGTDSLLAPWLDRWRMFPVLASLVTLTLVNWFRAAEEMIHALEQDHAAVADSLSGSTTPRAIEAIHGDAGDPHLGGRSVMLLTFADGARVVFKPKRLAVTDVFRTLVARINATGLVTPLRVHPAIVRDHHTWEAFVPHRPCATEADVGHFYRHMGGWIRLLQVIEGRDFWLDNLIADGEFPMFIDLETILQPRRRDANLSRAAALAQSRIDASPVATNIVAMAVPIGPGVAGEDLGCFATPRDYLSPFPATEIAGVRAAGSSRDGYRTWTHPEHAPILNGQPVEAHRWYGEVEAGYREMATAIATIAPELLEPGGPIDQLCEHPVRTIYRDTWTCIRIIHRSTAPPLLGNHTRRRAFLERMDAGAAPNPVVAAEVRAMLALDVPFFSAYGHDDAIHPPDGPPVRGFFEHPPRVRVAEHLAGGTSHLADDVAMLRTTFWTAHPQTPVPASLDTPAHPSIAAGAWLTAALTIAEAIAEARMVADDGSDSWAVLTNHPSADIAAWSPIGNDLLSGRAGLVMLFCDMWRATADDRWRSMAASSTRELIDAAGMLVDLWGTSENPAGRNVAIAPVIGALTGIGGMLAAIKLAADTFDDNRWHEAWQQRVDALDWSRLVEKAEGDVIGGSIGLACALTARPTWFGQMPAALQTALRTIGDHEPSTSANAWPPGTLAGLSGVPGTAMAHLLVQDRLGGCGATALNDHIGDLLAGAPAAGDLLVAIELGRSDAPWWPHLSDVVLAAVECEQDAPNRLGQIDAAELALAMWRATGDTTWGNRAASLANRWIADYTTTGSWFPADLADDRHRLSSVLGLPAIASVMLRLSGAPVASAPRTFNWQAWAAP